jgi:hypothetical protein
MSNHIYSILQLPKWFNGPTVLQSTLRDVWETPYYDLYEDDTTHRTFEAFERVLSAFGLPQESVTHRRYVYMGLAMALATRPTLAYRFPEDKRADMAAKKLALDFPLPFGDRHDEERGTEEMVLSLDMQLVSAASVR